MSEPMRIMQSSLVGIALFGVVLSTACNKSQPGNQLPTVAPDRSGVPAAKPLPDPELGEVFIIDEWTIQMPKGYGLSTQVQNNETTAAIWQAPAADAPVGPRLFWLRIVQTPKGKQAPTAAQLREVGFSLDYRETEPEIVSVGGRSFERVRTTGRLDETGHALRGFQYVSVGQPCIVMNYKGDGDDDESFREADAAARSLRQR